MTADRITAYVTWRQEQKAANATINRELSALKRMFRLGRRAKKVDDIPHIETLQEDNVRKGFFEQDQFEAVLEHLHEDLKAPMATAYITGWRIKSEILTRQKPHLDLSAGWLRLEPGETKNKKGRMFPLIPPLREVLESQRARTERIERETSQVIPWLFHRNANQLHHFPKSINPKGDNMRREATRVRCSNLWSRQWKPEGGTETRWCGDGESQAAPQPPLGASPSRPQEPYPEHGECYSHFQKSG